MAKKQPEWFDVLVTALTSNSETAGRKRAIRSAAQGKDVSDLQAPFVLWVLREFLPPFDEAHAVAALWDRRMSGDEPNAGEWAEAAEAARAASERANAGDLGGHVSKMVRSPALTTPAGQRSLLMVEPTLDQGAVEVYRGEYAKAREAARIADACDAAWSAALVNRPDAMRGVVTSAARTAADLGWAYRQMADKLVSML